MLMFTLVISCLSTSNMPWFMDLTFQVPRQYCSLQHWTLFLSPVISTTRCCFLLWLHLFILSGVISPLNSSSKLGTYQPGDFIFQCYIFLPFHTLMVFERLWLWACVTLGFMTSERISIQGQRQVLTIQSFLCGKVSLKYNRDRESFWHRHQKGTERVPAC